MMIEQQDPGTTDEGVEAALGLSFSGGGYRAAAYALGSMSLLQDLGLLGRAKVLSGVSGGSVAIGAYLCSKAGSGATRENEFRFYSSFYTPFLNYLNTESLAESFVNLPRLLSGKKILHAAADQLDGFLEAQLHPDARRVKGSALLCNEKITRMLTNTQLRPDYVFFNTSNITTLDLFRFGLQRTNNNTSPTYFLNRYYLKPCSDETCTKLHHHAGQIRIADCVASSFAFPIGFEPMIFPHDFFRADNRREGTHWPAAIQSSAHGTSTHTHERPWEAAKAAFGMTPICDHKPYIAFLDGGLYDNLGLASIEDIRLMINRNRRDRSAGDYEKEASVRYVIATDVDNIQPSNSSYRDPDLDAELQDAAAAGDSQNRLVLHWPPRRSLLAGAKVLLIAAMVGGLTVAATWQLFGTPLNGSLVAIVVVNFLWVLLSSGLLVLVLGLWLSRRLRGWKRGLLDRKQSTPQTPGPSLAQRLGLGSEFQDSNQALDPGTSLLGLLIGLLFKPNPARRMSALRSALLYRRANQLVPAFSGYLKRTRSLTYGYLEQVYSHPDSNKSNNGSNTNRNAPTSPGDDQGCALIRNMIFELCPGPDVDPEHDASRITLPARDYAKREDQDGNGPNWAVSRKMRRATNIGHWLSTEGGGLQPDSSAGRHASAVWRRLQSLIYETASLKGQFPCYEDLQLKAASSIWLWLHEQFCFDHRKSQQPRDEMKLPREVNPELCALVEQVQMTLRGAMLQANKEQPDLESQLRKRGQIQLDKTTSNASWIPLICEMATNLPTTLWTSGFRWYVFSAPAHNGDNQPGGWYSYRPDGGTLNDRLWIDFGKDASMANHIAVLAGYICMAFNILEFAYTTLASDKHQKHD